MTFQMVERQGLVVWMYSLKQLKLIRKHGIVHYVSDKLKYVILYVDKDEQDEVIKTLERYHFVRKVETSHRDDIDMTFKDAIPNRKDVDHHSAGKRETVVS